MAKAFEVKRGFPVADERRTEPAEWAAWRRTGNGATGAGPATRVVSVPEHPGQAPDTSFGAGVDIRVGERR